MPCCVLRGGMGVMLCCVAGLACVEPTELHASALSSGKGVSRAAKKTGAPDMTQAASAIPLECQGFPLAGLKYSPGGTVLPNTCMPFDATLNNPYAVRCIDAIPGFASGFPGDEYCILPPAPDRGVQLGYHPQGDVDTYWQQIWDGDFSGYRDPGSDWLVSPGNEITQSYRAAAGVSEDQKYYRVYRRVRTGTHHAVLTLVNPGQAAGWESASSPALTFIEELLGLRASLGGAQRPADNFPSTLETPTDDQRIYWDFAKDSDILINVHSLNGLDHPTLREGWVNIFWEPDATLRATWYMGINVEQVLTLDVEPGTTADYNYAVDIVKPTRLLSAIAHRHAWTSNFSAWIEHEDQTIDPIYRSVQWDDPPTYRYDSTAQNPAIDAGTGDGASSGLLSLEVGDRLHFSCHIEYTDARAAAVGAPKRPSEAGPLHFSNELFGGEMCVAFGSALGEPFDGLPKLDTAPLPTFATE